VDAGAPTRGWNAFRVGLSRAARYRRVLLILFAVNLAIALLLAVLPALGLAAGLGRRPSIRQAADGADIDPDARTDARSTSAASAASVDAWLVFEMLLAPMSGAALGEEAWSELTRWLRQMASLGLLTAALLPIGAWLSTALLSGGVLLTYAEAPGPFRCRRFLWGCWHWFGAFLLLGAAQGVASLVLFVPLVGVAIAAVAAFGGWLAWVVVPLLALLALLWLALVDYTRIAAVVEGTRNVARAFGGAVRFICRRPLAIVGLYGPAILLLGLVQALYRWGLAPLLPLRWWPLVLVVRQAFILVRLWVRLTRLAGAVALFGARPTEWVASA